MIWIMVLNNFFKLFVNSLKRENNWIDTEYLLIQWHSYIKKTLEGLEVWLKWHSTCLEEQDPEFKPQ
jgi:hypothetical protein